MVHTHRTRTLDHKGTVVIVAVVRQVDADVDQVVDHCGVARRLRELHIACYLAAPGKTRGHDRCALRLQ